MDTQHILEKIQKPETLKVSDEMAFKKLAINYPYFQAAQALHLKILKTEESFEFKKHLRSAALHTANRSILFDYINKDIQEQENAVESINKHQNVSDLGLTQEDADKINDPELFENKYAKSKQKNERHNFNDWLNLTKLKPLDHFEDKKDNIIINKEQRQKNKLIDEFIQNNPKIKPTSKIEKPLDKGIKTQPSQQLMTETLANIYLEQKKYDKAIEAYNILILNNPKKSGFFADQIKTIKALQNN